MPALERERCMMSLMVLCRGILPKPREQDNQWLPLASIRAPQAHICGSHNATPRPNHTPTFVPHITRLHGERRPPLDRPRLPVLAHMQLLVRKRASHWRAVKRQPSDARCCIGLLYYEAVF